MTPVTRISRRSSQTLPVVRPDAEPLLLPLVPEDKLNPDAYLRWRRDVIEAQS
jgi:hypothetical protein